MKTTQAAPSLVPQTEGKGPVVSRRSPVVRPVPVSTDGNVVQLLIDRIEGRERVPRGTAETGYGDLVEVARRPQVQRKPASSTTLIAGGLSQLTVGQPRKKTGGEPIIQRQPAGDGDAEPATQSQSESAQEGGSAQEPTFEEKGAQVIEKVRAEWENNPARVEARKVEAKQRQAAAAQTQWRMFQVPLDQGLLKLEPTELQFELALRFFKAVMASQSIALGPEMARRIYYRLQWVTTTSRDETLAQVKKFLPSGKLPYRSQRVPLIVFTYGQLLQEDRERWALGIEIQKALPNYADAVFRDLGRGVWNGVAGIINGALNLPVAPINLVQSIRGEDSVHITSWPPKFESYETHWGRTYGSSVELGTQLGLVLFGGGAGAAGSAGTASKVTQALSWASKTIVGKTVIYSALGTMGVDVAKGIRDITRGYKLDANGNHIPITDDDVLGTVGNLIMGVVMAHSVATSPKTKPTDPLEKVEAKGKSSKTPEPTKNPETPEPTETPETLERIEMPGSTKTPKLESSTDTSKQVESGKPIALLSPGNPGIGGVLSNQSLNVIEARYGLAVRESTKLAQTMEDLSQIGSNLGSLRNEFLATITELATVDLANYAGELALRPHGTGTTPGMDVVSVSGTGDPVLFPTEVKAGGGPRPYRIGASGMPKAYHNLSEFYKQLYNILRDKTIPIQTRVRIKQAIDSGKIEWRLDAHGNVRLKVRGKDIFPDDIEFRLLKPSSE